MRITTETKPEEIAGLARQEPASGTTGAAERKAIDCMVQHIKDFEEQSYYDREADFGEPCSNCRYNQSCKFDWLSVMKPLLDKSSVTIRLCHPEPPDKQGRLVES